MKVTKVSEVADMDDGDSIKALSGKITKAYERKTGSSEKGDWSVQNAFFEDSSGKIKLSVWNQDDLSRFVSKEVAIEAHHGDKGWSGVYAEDNNYNGKTTRQVKLTATAAISPYDADSSAAEPPGARPYAKTVPTQRAEKESDSSEGYESARHFLMKVMNAFWMIEKAVQVETDQARVNGIECTPENFGGKCGSAFRTLLDKGFVDKLPDKPLWSIASKEERDERA